jgi:ribulose bisphosphate carboxylase small subunit
MKKIKKLYCESKKLTKPQQNAIDVLLGGGFKTSVDFEGNKTFKTGLNTSILASLEKIGVLKATRVYRGGVITSDFTITECK